MTVQVLSSHAKYQRYHKKSSRAGRRTARVMCFIILTEPNRTRSGRRARDQIVISRKPRSCGSLLPSNNLIHRELNVNRKLDSSHFLCKEIPTITYCGYREYLSVHTSILSQFVQLDQKDSSAPARIFIRLSSRSVLSVNEMLDEDSLLILNSAWFQTSGERFTQICWCSIPHRGQTVDLSFSTCC